MHKKLASLLYGAIILALILTSCSGMPEPIRPTPTLTVQIDQGQVPPQIVAQEPIQGGRLDLTSPRIKITFNQNMDQGRTSGAFLLLGPDGQALSGKVTWPDERTFSFQPDEKLAASAVYTATFSTDAASAQGIALPEPIELRFNTVESIAVSQVFPADGTEEIDMATNITVIFNQPIVPVSIEEEQDQLPQPLIFLPEVKGKGDWVNSSVYVFEPEETLQSGTRYVVQVKAGLKSVTGRTLGEPYRWHFSTREPAIGNFGLINGEQNPTQLIQNARLDQAFYVEFLQPMQPENLKEAVSLINRETGKAFPFRLKWNEDSTMVQIEPVGRYQVASFYNLEISSTALAEDGGNLKEGLEIKFGTIPLPGIKELHPAPDSVAETYDASIAITFVSPMDFNSVKSRIRISPQPANELNYYYDEYGWTVYIYGLEPSRDYVVRLLPGMTDIYGNSIASETSFAFTTGPMSPYVRVVLPWVPLVYRAGGPQEVFLEHTNLDAGTVSLYPVTFAEFTRMLKGDLEMIRFKPQVEPLREWTIAGDAPRDQLNRLNLQLEDRQGHALRPGYYFIGVQGEPLEYFSNFYQGNLFIVASDNITFKATDTEGLAWITDLETGQPQPDVEVTFYGEKYNELGRVKTDRDGLAYLKGVNSPTSARLEDTGHLSFTALDWGSGVWAGDFGIYEGYYAQTNRPFAYVYTDRPVYRPGQDVFYKGIVRQNDDLHYSLPKDPAVYVKIDHFGEEIFADYIELSELGSFTGQLTLDENAATGNYDIMVMARPNGDTFGWVSFSVAEYHKPEFEVSASADQTAVLPGATVNFSMDTQYYSGGSVARADADWFLQNAPFYFQPARDYQQYNFSDWDQDAYWAEQKSTETGRLTEGKAVTDENGHIEIAQKLDLNQQKTSQTITFYANVTDVGGNLVSGSTSVTVHQSELYAGIRSEKHIGIAGEEHPFDIVVLDWDSKPAAGQNVSVKFIERQWFSVQEQDQQGQSRWVTTVKEIPAGTQTGRTDEDGRVSLSFTPQRGGIFKAVVTVRDSQGNSHRASTYVWVASDDHIAWRQTNDRTFSLVADKDAYSPGDTAEVLIAQPFEHEVYALVTYERGHIYKQDVVLLKGTSTIYKIPITGDMAPVAYVSVAVVSGAEAFGKPSFKIGMAMLNIDTSEQILDVSVSTDQETAGPGEEITYTITTRDHKGEPVSADVSLAVVDKAVLALAPANSPPLLDAFYSEQSLGVRTALAIVVTADDFNAQYRESIPEGGGMGGGGGGELGIVTVRQDFKDTAAFEGLLATDEAGRAQVTVKLPENLTTWHADVRAVTTDSRVGQATNEILSTRPLFVEMTTPRFFVVGDQAQIGAIVHNNTDRPLTVQVDLEAEGVTLADEASQSVAVEANRQTYVTWDLTVGAVERVDFTVRASSGQYQDASKPALGTLEGQGIPVYNFTAVETVGTSGMLMEANSATEGMQLPVSLDYTDARLSIEIAPSLAASMQSGLKYLEDYPYLCMEQTISRFLPNVINLRALQAAGLHDPAIKNKLDMQVNSALQRIYARQLYDGGWNWWNGDKSDPYVSAYVVYGLIEARESGYAVTAGVLNRGLSYLGTNLPNLRRNESNWQYNRHAFMLYVLARGKRLQAGQTNFIYENRDMLSLYAKAYLAQTIYLLDPNDKRVTALLSDLAGATIQSSSGAHWEENETDYWNWNTDTRTTAIVLNAFVQTDALSPHAANAVRWLMAHRAGGHWASTQETAWTLIALTNWLTASKELAADYQYAVGLNGELLEQGNATSENLTDTLKLQVELEDLLKDEVNYLVITRGEGTGNLYYTAYMSTSLPVESIQPLDQGVSISREYFATDDPKHPVTEIERGELVRVRLTVVVPAAVHYIVIDDPLPAGLEAVDASLNPSIEVPSRYTREDYDQHGWGWWYFYNQEIRDEKVTLSTDYLPAGTYVYTYLARASTPGMFKVIPPTASEFYFPDVGGRGAGSLFVVK